MKAPQTNVKSTLMRSVEDVLDESRTLKNSGRFLTAANVQHPAPLRFSVCRNRDKALRADQPPTYPV